MAQRKKDWVKAKVWLETMTMEFEGSIAASIRELMRALPADRRPKMLEILSKDVGVVHADQVAVFDLVAHLHRQRAFSERTFGPGVRTSGVLDHIKRELVEIEDNPGDVMEWVDVILLALDGAWRAGHEPEVIAAALAAKQSENEARQWPDWRTVEEGKAIEHVRAGDA